MKNLLNKIIQIAQVIISAIFVIMFIATIMGIIPITTNSNGKVVCDSFMVILMLILGTIYTILSIMIVANAISSANKLKYLKIKGNYETVSYVNVGAIKKTCKDKAKILKEIKVLKVNVYSNDLNNLSLNITISLKSEDVNQTTDKYRLILVETFMRLYEIKFSTINFKIKKILENHQPDMEKIENALSNNNKNKDKDKEVEKAINEALVNSKVEESKKDVKEVETEKQIEEVKTEQEVEKVETEQQVDEQEVDIDEKIVEENFEEDKIQDKDVEETNNQNEDDDLTLNKEEQNEINEKLDEEKENEVINEEKEILNNEIDVVDEEIEIVDKKEDK